MTVDQERLKRLLNYCPETGKFTWLVDRRPSVRAGDEAGTLRDDGYIRIQLDGERRYASHWAWLYMTGELPKDEVDHIDRDRANNAWSNLRAATKSQNCANRVSRGNECNGLRGVAKRGKKFVAQLKVGEEIRYLGIYPTPELAHQAYVEEAVKVFGDFAMVAANDNEKMRRAA